ncbi:MAG: hypothetical protein HY508_12450 [Acidobacteria bacterium]|nr:hypothetical protein [Acidobacteriota bacterium]
MVTTASINFFNPELHKPVSHAAKSWMSELDAPGAQQMRYVKALMLSRPYFTRIPDQSVIVGDAGEGVAHIGATRDREGSYMMVYLPQGQPVTVDTVKLSGLSAVAWWYDPRTGVATRIQGSFQRSGTVTFIPPSKGPESDWVLVLDTEGNNFGAPGAEPGKR